MGLRVLNPPGRLGPRAGGLRLGERTLVMGILNVTPDSFSGDGLAVRDVDSIVARGEDLVAAGADLLDVGGESTRPGRSEEHTSELQSRQYLVCRLLLEKKKRRA